MAHVIGVRCVDVKNLLCARVCPVDCIHYEPGPDRMAYIDPSECIDCHACSQECPANAVFAREDLPARQHPWIDVNALWYRDREAARAMVDHLSPR